MVEPACSRTYVGTYIIPSNFLKFSIQQPLCRTLSKDLLYGELCVHLFFFYYISEGYILRNVNNCVQIPL